MNILDLKEKIIETRRYLHQIPESAFEEYKTSEFIKKELTEMGYQVEQVAKTGVMAFRKGTGSQRPICFRADMDALFIEEKTGVDFASKNGFMHACGHDGHMTMLLGFARYLSSLKEIKRSVLLLFQPGEENAGGGEVVLNDAAFKKYDVEYIFGTHLQPDLKEGIIGTKPGAFMAQTIEFNISIEGISSHGAQPHNGIDAIYVASQLISSYQSIISRNINPLESAVITIGKINGGTMRNLIADRVTLEGTLRTFNMDVYNHVIDRINEVNEGLEKMYGVKIKADFIDFCPPVVNDPYLYKKFAEGMKPGEFVEMDPLTISEDFGFYQTKIPGLFLMLGTRNEKLGYVNPLHSSNFNFDESVLLKGIQTYIGILEKFDAI